MATKTIQTRIKNRFDTLAEWGKPGVTLLPGEIALVSVTTQQIDQATGDVVNVPAVLMKVGTSDGNGGAKTFSELPWVSALAADVYDWAKNPTIEEVPVTIMVGTTATSGTLSEWLKTINDQTSTNAAGISSLDAKVDVDKVSTAISSAVSALETALTHTGTQGENQIVKAVTQANGKVTVTYGTITEAELPNISSNKIVVDDENTTLADKLSTMDAEIASKADAHDHDAFVNQNAFSNIKVGEETLVADNSTDTVEFVGNNITITPDSTNNKITFVIEEGSADKKGIVTLGVSGGAATYESIYGADGKNGINAQVETNKADIANLKAAITGGIHFIGTVTDIPTAETTQVGDSVVTVGDVVIYKAPDADDFKEYICIAVTENAATWEVLGDVTRIGALETKINDLDYENTTDSGVNKFVTHITQTNGKIAVSYAQPTSENIKHGTDSTVNEKLGDIDAAIASHLEDHDKYTNQNAFSKIVVASQTDVEADSATDTVTFEGENVAITTDATNGKVKFTVADAAIGTKGVVSLLDSVSSESTTEAATASAVKTAYDKGAEAVAAVAAIAENYIKISGDSLVDQDGLVIIFDCGGAPVE